MLNSNRQRQAQESQLSRKLPKPQLEGDVSTEQDSNSLKRSSISSVSSSGGNQTSPESVSDEDKDGDGDGDGDDDDDDDVIQATDNPSSQKSLSSKKLFTATPVSSKVSRLNDGRIEIPPSYKPLPNKDVMEKIMKSLGFQAYGLGETTRLGTVHAGKKRGHSEIATLPIESFGVVLMDFERFIRSLASTFFFGNPSHTKEQALQTVCRYFVKRNLCTAKYFEDWSKDRFDVLWHERKVFTNVMFKNWGDIFRDPSMRKTFAALELHSKLGNSWMTGQDEDIKQFFMITTGPRTILSLTTWDSTRKMFSCEPYTEFVLHANYPDLFSSPDPTEVDKRIGPFKMAVDFVVGTRKILQKNGRLLQKLFVGYNDKDCGFGTELASLIKKMTGVAFPSNQGKRALAEFMREKQEAALEKKPRDPEETKLFAEGIKILLHCQNVLASMYSELAHCTLQIVFAHFRCPKGLILFSPFLEKNLNPRSIANVRLTLNKHLLGAVYCSMYFWHVNQWHLKKGDEVSFLISGGKDSEYLEHFKEFARLDIAEVFSENLVAKELDLNLTIIRHIYQHFTPDALLLKEIGNKGRAGTPAKVNRAYDGLEDEYFNTIGGFEEAVEAISTEASAHEVDSGDETDTVDNS